MDTFTAIPQSSVPPPLTVRLMRGLLCTIMSVATLFALFILSARVGAAVLIIAFVYLINKYRLWKWFYLAYAVVFLSIVGLVMWAAYSK